VHVLTPVGSIALVVFGGILLIGFAGVGVRLAEMRSRMGVLSRVEAKIDLLLEQANIKFDPYAKFPAKLLKPCGQVRRLRRSNYTVNQAESVSKRQRTLLKSSSGGLVPRK
jgi:hypothetical protein